MPRRLRVLAGALLLASCKGPSAGVTAQTWPEADALFHADPRWLGADGAYTVDLGQGRSLWLFGDTYLAREPGGTRQDALFLRNTVAVQTGRDPSRALIEFSWGVDADGGPQSFLAQDGSDWFWPGGGARIGGSLLIFWSRVRSAPNGGFDQYDWRVTRVANPDDAPAAWTFTDAMLPADTHGVVFAAGNMLDGGYLYAYGDDDQPAHQLRLVRWDEAHAAAGDLRTPEWWCGDHWDSSSGASPSILISLAAPELSVHHDGRLAPYVMVQSEGYGATTLALRTAPAPQGPWSDPESFFRPPESAADDAFVYAGKAHPELTGASLVATYAPTVFGDTPANDDLYRPHFVRIEYP